MDRGPVRHDGRGARGFPLLLAVTVVVLLLPSAPGGWARSSVSALVRPSGGTFATLGSEAVPLAPAPCPRLACGNPAPTEPDALAPSEHGAPPALGLGSSATNWYVSNWSGEGMIAENPNDPLNLVAGGLYQYPSTHNSSVYYTSGVSGVSTSFDGGRSWTTQTLPASPLWSQSSSPQCGHIHLADTAIVFGANDTVYYLDLSYYDPGPGVSCSGSLAGTGLFVTISRDGGAYWADPIGVAGMSSGSSVDKPWMAIDLRSGLLYVAYTDDRNGSVVAFQRSNDSGATWSSPKDISSGGPGSGSMRGVELAVDRWGGVDAEWIDQNSGLIEFTRSTDHGASFARPVAVATALAEYTSPAPDAFRAYTLPGIGLDTLGSGGRAGRIYITWQNGSGGAVGTPAVALSASSDNGSHWSAPVTVNSDTRLENFQPDVAVTADGTVYVEWYGENVSNGHYRLYGSLSHDGGRHFDRQIAVSDTDSYPQYSTQGGGNAWWIGDYTHVIADAIGARPLWTDARSRAAWACSPCLWGYDYNISFYTAELTNATLRASAPTNLTLNGTVPGPAQVAVTNVHAYRDWLVGQRYDLSAPTTVTTPSGEEYFALWFGSFLTTNASVNGTVRGPLDLTACYADSPGGACHMPGAPGRLALSVTPANASVWRNGSAIALDAAGRYTVWADPGPNSFRASAAGYFPWNGSALVTPGNVTYVNISLVPIKGTIIVHVEPIAASVAIVPARPLTSLGFGYYNASLVPGDYELVATLVAYAPASVPFTVVAIQTAFVNATLAPLPGWINGTITPSGAGVKINGGTVAVNASGEFAARLPPGSYWVNASAPGYAPVSRGPFVMTPFGALSVNLWLPSLNGVLVGTVAPADASVWVSGAAVPVMAGTFTAPLAPGTYTILAERIGYSRASTTALVVANTSSSVALALPVAPGWITATIDPSGATARIDGRPAYVGSDGRLNVSVAAGPHVLSVTLAGYDTYEANVTVAAGHATSVTVALVPSPGALAGTLTVEIAALALAAVVAAAAGFVLWRRRSRRPPPSAARPRPAPRPTPPS
jgi:PEGA domain